MPPSTARAAEQFVNDWTDRVYDAVARALTDLLRLAREAIFGPDDDTYPDMANWPDDTVWIDLIERYVLPELEELWADAWADSTSDMDMQQYASEYIVDVSNRLTGVNAQAWDDVSETLEDSILAGDDVRATRDAVARALNMDALTRDAENTLRRINEQLQDTKLNQDRRASLERRRRELLDTVDIDRRRWEWRAERIARTETIGASNGAIEAYAVEMQLQTGQVRYRQWWSSMDGRTRMSHRVAHMQVIGPGDKFVVGGSTLAFPGDPLGPAREVVNCRCVMLLLTQDAAATHRDEYDARRVDLTDDAGNLLDDDGNLAATSS